MEKHQEIIDRKNKTVTFRWIDTKTNKIIDERTSRYYLLDETREKYNSVIQKIVTEWIDAMDKYEFSGEDLGPCIHCNNGIQVYTLKPRSRKVTKEILFRVSCNRDNMAACYAKEAVKQLKEAGIECWYYEGTID